MSLSVNDIRKTILDGNAVLGIELGSTRIKAVLIGENHEAIASGSHDWENSYRENVWTYSLEEIWTGVQNSYHSMAEIVKQKYEVNLQKIKAIGFSGMMHGYMAFDQKGELLVPFRTWRNTITEPASDILTELFQYNIPQRWSIAHLYQAILNKEAHVKNVAFFTTVAGYIHWKLTGQKVLGVGEASGMFPIDLNTNSFNTHMIEQFNHLVEAERFSWKLEEVMPKVLVAGESAGVLSEEGARLLDITGELQAGIPLCPPEGDAGTGMVATNSVAKRTGNVSAGTSVFAMIVLERELSKVYHEIDLVTTPSGSLVAMAHSNNCSSDLNAWVSLFDEFSKILGAPVDANRLYELLYNQALQGDSDCGGLLSFGYLSGEHITGFEEGRPLFVRSAESKFNLANFMRTHLYTSLGALKIGLDILLKKEGVELDEILGHGGLFKTKGVGQKIMAAAINVPVSVMETAGEGGAWGIAILASYMAKKDAAENLENYLNKKVFAEMPSLKMEPEQNDVQGFEQFMELYKKGLAVERAAVDSLK